MAVESEERFVDQCGVSNSTRTSACWRLLREETRGIVKFFTTGTGRKGVREQLRS